MKTDRGTRPSRRGAVAHATRPRRSPLRRRRERRRCSALGPGPIPTMGNRRLRAVDPGAVRRGHRVLPATTSGTPDHRCHLVDRGTAALERIRHWVADTANARVRTGPSCNALLTAVRTRRIDARDLSRPLPGRTRPPTTQPVDRGSGGDPGPGLRRLAVHEASARITGPPIPARDRDRDRSIRRSPQDGRARDGGGTEREPGSCADETDERLTGPVVAETPENTSYSSSFTQRSVTAVRMGRPYDRPAAIHGRCVAASSSQELSPLTPPLRTDRTQEDSVASTESRSPSANSA